MSAPHIIDALHDLDRDLEAEHTPQPDPVDAEPAPARRQPGQLVEVLVEGCDPYTVVVANREVIAYERTAAKHREWPVPTRENPGLGTHFQMTFCTFVAAKRAGRFDGTFDRWCEVLEDWNLVQDVAADPTR